MPRLSTIIGQDAVLTRLKTIAGTGSVGQAYLFAGLEKVGKTTTARAFAKALNCEQAGALIGGPEDACDICTACRQIDAGSYPDVHLVRPALVQAEAVSGDRRVSTEILISQIREMNRMLSLSPSVGRRKIFIVTPAEAMNEQAQNALLKSLEEPPVFSTVILCAQSPESVLPTIQSRCQVFRFGISPRPLIQHRLRELFGLPVEEAEAVAALSRGRVGLAFRFAAEPGWRQARARLMDGLEAALAAGPLAALQAAPILRDAAQKVPVLVDSLAGGETEAVSDRVAGRLQLQMLFEEFANLLRDLVLLKLDEGGSSSRERPGPEDSASGIDDLLVNLDRKASLTRLARSLPEPRLQSTLAAVMTAQDLLRRNVTPQLLLEDVLLEITAPA